MRASFKNNLKNDFDYIFSRFYFYLGRGMSKVTIKSYFMIFQSQMGFLCGQGTFQIFRNFISSMHHSLVDNVCLVTQSCPTLCNPMDYSPPGSSVPGDSPGKNIGVGCHALLHGIFQTQGSNSGLLHCRWILYHLSHQGSPRILEWVAYPFSRGPSQPRN